MGAMQFEGFISSDEVQLRLQEFCETRRARDRRLVFRHHGDDFIKIFGGVHYRFDECVLGLVERSPFAKHGRFVPHP